MYSRLNDKKQQKYFYNSTYFILFLIMVLTVALRLYMLNLNVKHYRDVFYYDHAQLKEKITIADRPFQHPFGAEVANVAYSIVCKKEGLSNPFGADTGPTGWVSPGMALLYAFAFYMFGCFTSKAMMFLFLFAMGLSLVIMILVYRLGIMLFGNITVGYIGALLWAVSPHDLRIFKHIGLQDFNIMILAFLLVLYLLLRFAETLSYKHLVLSAMTGVGAVLCNPVFIVPIAGCVIGILLKSKERFLLLRKIALYIGIFMLLLAPYIIYQHTRLHAWTLIKSNGMFELYLGNVPDFNGVLDNELFGKYHPMMNQDEFLHYKALGEIAYINSRWHSFLDTLDMKAFIRRTAHRVFNFLLLLPPFSKEEGIMRPLLFSRGLVLLLFLLLFYNRMNLQKRLLYVYCACYALPYCLCGIMYRYSIPLAPLDIIMAAYLIYMTGKWMRKRIRNSQADIIL